MPNWAKWLIGGIAFTGAVVLTALTGGALASLFIGMGVSIVVGGTQYIMRYSIEKLIKMGWLVIV